MKFQHSVLLRVFVPDRTNKKPTIDRSKIKLGSNPLKYFIFANFASIMAQPVKILRIYANFGVTSCQIQRFGCNNGVNYAKIGANKVIILIRNANIDVHCARIVPTS